jgi:Fe-S protein assembly co-chaperone HscB
MTSVDHFARFGLSASYAVDAKALDQAYERLSFELHPDFLANASPEEKQRAQQASAELNEAYRVLRSEPERAAYLLGLLAAGRKLNMEALPANFLQEMFLLQEEVEEATGAAADAIRAQVETRHRDTLAERARLFEQAVTSSAAADGLQAIQSNLNQEKYLLRLLARLNGSAE